MLSTHTLVSSSRFVKSDRARSRPDSCECPLPVGDPSDLPPQQPWLHELVVTTCAPATSSSDRRGDMGAAGTGLFVDDRRVLSRWGLTLGAESPAAVVASGGGSQAEFLTAARRTGSPGPDPTVHLRRTRRVRADGMSERIEILSRSATWVRTRLRLQLAGDGAEVAAVKADLADDPLAAALPVGRLGDDLGWSDERHETRLTAAPLPTAVILGGPGRAAGLEFDVDLAPRSTWRLDLTVVSRRRTGTGFDADAGGDALDWRRVQVSAADPTVERTVHAGLRDLQALVLRDPLDPRDVFVAAGTPWYLTLFGRDSLWCARFMLPFGTELAAGTLRALARRMGRTDDPTSQEEPGRIPHEVRRAPFVDATAGLDLPPVYYGTVDATALWLGLWAQAWRHGMPEDEVRDLLPAAREAFGWLRRSTRARPDGLLAYRDPDGRGLANQGWKDSDDAMRRADGSIPPSPIALVEAQGYVVEAARGGADVLDALGEPGAAAWRALATTTTERIRATFWTGSPAHPAMAVAGDGSLVDGVGSNMGHLLGSGALTPDEAGRIAARLTAPDMLGEYGIATLSRDNPAYNPLGYHTESVWTHDTAVAALGMSREGLSEASVRVVRALLRAAAAFDGRLPELFAGDVTEAPAPYPAACRPQGWAAAAVGAMVTAWLGLEVDVPGRRVRLRPATGLLTVRGLRFGRQTFDVTVPARGVPVVTGLPPEVAVELPD